MDESSLSSLSLCLSSSVYNTRRDTSGFLAVPIDKTFSICPSFYVCKTRTFNTQSHFCASLARTGLISSCAIARFYSGTHFNPCACSTISCSEPLSTMCAARCDPRKTPHVFLPPRTLNKRFSVRCSLSLVSLCLYRSLQLSCVCVLPFAVLTSPLAGSHSLTHQTAVRHSAL